MSALVPATPLHAPVAAVATVKKRRRRALVRNADDSRLYNLMLDVNALRSEVQRLELSRHLIDMRSLVARENQRGAMLSTSSRMFHAFRNGYRPDRWTPGEQGFMGWVFDEQVAVDAATTGRRALFEQWWLYTELFRMESYSADSVRVLVSDDEVNDCVVEALGAFDGRMTREALAVVFPHVVGDRELEDMVIGRALHCPLRTRLHFDRSGRITKYLVDADMLTAISQLVGRSLELVAALMAHARINEASMIDVEDDAVVNVRRNQGPACCDEQPKEVAHASEMGAAYDDAGADMASHRQSIAFILS